MQLKNAFSEETRNIFYEVRYQCFTCNGNGTNCGGMELHHIAGRISNSPLNAAPLCKGCHALIGHSEEEEIKLFATTLLFLLKVKYNFTNHDIQFAEEYERCGRAIRDRGAKFDL